MITDMHVHTCFSSDSTAPVETQVRKALSLGMKHIAISDHQDYDYPPWHSIYLLSETGDTEGYLSVLREVREKYEGRIEVLIGIELGLQVPLGKRLDRYVAAYPFDFVIGSTHFFNGRDTEDPALYRDCTEEDACRAYFQTELDNRAATDAYDVVGHLDFVLRDLPSKNRYFSYRTYADLLDEILLTVIRKGKGIECNTKTLYRGMGQPSPDTSVLKRYRELGGEIITFGSDAHQPDWIGGAFVEASEILRECGFRYYCIFRDRKPVFLPLAQPRG